MRAGLTEVHIFIATFVLGIAGAFESPATAALLPLIAPQGSLQRATAISSGAAQVATITGPALGGFAYALAPSLPYGIMVLFWLLGAILTGGIRTAPQAAREDSASSDDLFAGVRFVRSNPAILGTISLDLFAVLFGGVTALLPIYAHDILDTGPLGPRHPARRTRGRCVADDGRPGAPYDQPPRRHADVPGGDHLRRGDRGVRALALDVAVGAGAGDPGCGGYCQCGDPLLAGAARDAKRNARPRRRGEFPVHQCQ